MSPHAPAFLGGDDPEALLTTAQVAQIYGVRVGTIRAWLCRHDPRLAAPTIQRINFVRWRRRDLLAHLEGYGNEKVVAMPARAMNGQRGDEP